MTDEQGGGRPRGPEVAARLVELLAGRPEVGGTEQAFPFVTVDDAGFPHVALLSRAEVGISADGRHVVAVVAGTRTPAHLERDGRACLIAIGGTEAHYAKLWLRERVAEDGAVGAAFEVVEHKVDSLGIPLEPVTFRVTADLPTLERWDRSARLLALLGVARDAGAGANGRPDART